MHPAIDYLYIHCGKEVLSSFYLHNKIKGDYSGSIADIFFQGLEND